ncbi:hypothetical protein [Arthrobacter sp. SDTb3-6]|nr:hypothetical protein [Arthrobacter sp. SDTb3-6]
MRANDFAGVTHVLHPVIGALSGLFPVTGPAPDVAGGMFCYPN